MSNTAIEAKNINSVRSFQYTNVGSIFLALLEAECERTKWPTADKINTILIKIIKNIKKSSLVSKFKCIIYYH
jgi:hypothetical protein